MITDGKIYVGTYAKYNNGSIYGKWLSVSDYSDKEDFLEACRELHSDEKEPEFMFQDWEEIPEEMISEGDVSEELFELAEELAGESDDTIEAFATYVDDIGVGWDFDKFQDAYMGQFDSEKDFAEHIFEEFYSFDTPEFAKTYFDYDAFARDLFMCDYRYVDGFVFRVD